MFQPFQDRNPQFFTNIRLSWFVKKILLKMLRFNFVLTRSLRKKNLGKSWILKGLKHMNTVIARRGGGGGVIQHKMSNNRLKSCREMTLHLYLKWVFDSIKLTPLFENLTKWIKSLASGAAFVCAEVCSFLKFSWIHMKQNNKILQSVLLFLIQ